MPHLPTLRLHSPFPARTGARERARPARPPRPASRRASHRGGREACVARRAQRASRQAGDVGHDGTRSLETAARRAPDRRHAAPLIRSHARVAVRTRRSTPLNKMARGTWRAACELLATRAWQPVRASQQHNDQARSSLLALCVLPTRPTVTVQQRSSRAARAHRGSQGARKHAGRRTRAPRLSHERRTVIRASRDRSRPPGPALPSPLFDRQVSSCLS